MKIPFLTNLQAFAIERTVTDANTLSNKTGALPRSIVRTFEQILQELDPKAEKQVIQEFRYSKTKTIIFIRFISILIFVPILAQQISKSFLVGPIVDQLLYSHKTEIFLNIELEEEAFRKLHKFEEQLKFKTLIGQAPDVSKQNMEKQLKRKASEIAKEYRAKSANALKNVFADTIALIAFCLTLVFSKQEIQIVKYFINEVAYNMSDSAKVFIIILSTDIFVGFHSPHGWEVILAGLARHLGLQENRDFIFLFIATFPVILDTIFKYWIFRYLSRMSPSAVATYKNMNE